ncbi:hypothetical protein CHUAL_007264 [Chamberlinius hualienensis]
MATCEKVKVLVVGDSGVGKSTFVHLICHCQPLCNPSWTIGCSVDIKIHEYKEGTPLQKTFFVELWDVGGSNSHCNSRSVFYSSVHGIILVHDLTNRKSEQNLRKWLTEILVKDSNAKGKSSDFEYDPEQFVESQVPILIVGTKQDLADEVRSSKFTRFVSSLSEDCGADEISLDCCQPKSLAPGSSNAVKLSRFFDKVIERRYFNKERNQSFLDKRRYAVSNSSKMLHSD